MAQTITISDPRIAGIYIDVENERVILSWNKTTDNGIIVNRGTFIFWKSVPVREIQPDNWYKLGSVELTAVVAIKEMAENFLSATVS